MPSDRKRCRSATPPATPESGGSRASECTIAYEAQAAPSAPVGEADDLLDRPASEILSVEQLATWLAVRGVPTSVVYQFGVVSYFELYPAPDTEGRHSMEQQLHEQLLGESTEEHLHVFRHLLGAERYDAMLAQLLLYVRQQILSRGRPLYIADAMHVLSAPDEEEPPSDVQSDTGTESFVSDDIFSADQNRLLSLFEDLLAEHAQGTCTRFERHLRAVEARRDLERGSRAEAGTILRQSLLEGEQEHWRQLLCQHRLERYLA